MAKTTVSQRHVDLYPELAPKLGETVDISVIKKAENNKEVAASDAKKQKARTEVAASAPAPVKTTKARAPRKAPAKKAK